MKRIALFAGSKATAEALNRQLESFLPKEMAVDVYVSDEGIESVHQPALVLFSSQALYDEVKDLEVVPKNKPHIVGKRTINYDKLEHVVSIADGLKVLLVNDLKEAAEETRAAMLEIGLDHMDLALYYPGAKESVEAYTMAITPGEMQYVPASIENVIDIGPRIFDFKTIARVLAHLDLLEASSGSFSKMYLEKIIKVAKGLSDSRAQVVKLNSNLARVIDSFDAGLLIYDQHQNIVVFNDLLKQILKVKKYQYVGNRLNRVIHNKKLLLFLMDGISEDNQSLELSIDGSDYIVSKFKMSQSDLICASFKTEKDHHLDKHIRSEALKKGYIAKYNLDDIVGNSPAINKQKEIVHKLAKTDMNILIYGESGTGKELTASAVHNLSTRKNAPFLAVNFSALPDDLIESELFGYEEGAFTGAKKGGKKGLFEEANGGTIFLDEIGDISLKVQARLLRVLEEKEVMPIGGGEIRPVDVRIIAATNKDLVAMIHKRQFREDLFFRLKMGYIQLQPLRCRKQDIPILCEHLAATMSAEKIEFDVALIERLMSQNWLGNVRELKNTLTYMLAVRTSDKLSILDLPDSNEALMAPPEEMVVGKQMVSDKEAFLTPEQGYFLNRIHEMLISDIPVSRKTLSKASDQGPYVRTENQVRRILNQLRDLNMLILSKGRKGIVLTKEATNWVEKGGNRVN